VLHSKYRLGSVLLVSAIALLSFLITSCASQYLHKIGFSWHIPGLLGEYELPKMNFLDTPVGDYRRLYDRRRDRFTPSLMIAANCLCPVLYPQVNSNSTDSENRYPENRHRIRHFLTDKDGQTPPQGNH